MSGLVNEYKSAADQNSELRIKVIQQTGLTKNEAKRAAELEEQLKLLREQQKEAIERLIERKDLEKERELLQLKVEYQMKIEKTNSEFTVRMQTSNDEVTAEIRELYEKIRVLQEQQLIGKDEQSKTNNTPKE